MLKVVHDVEASHESAGGSLLDEIVRDGARQMLAAALQAEVAAYIEAFKDEVDEAGRGWSSATVITCRGRWSRRRARSRCVRRGSTTSVSIR
jgi:phage host-nuclease inhibitor protein Gam